MSNKEIENKMFDIAVSLIKQRYPVGWGGAAVIRTEKNSYFSSVPIESANASVLLCIETGAICEAHKFNEKVTHCLCVVRDSATAPFKVLTPCGVCQERLRFWGEDVRVGVTTDNGELMFVELKNLQPFHWTKAYSQSELEKFIDDN